MDCVSYYSAYFYSNKPRANLRLDQLIRDLGWVGFELITLSHWIDGGRNPRAEKGESSGVSDTSEFWLFLGMELQ